MYAPSSSPHLRSAAVVATVCTALLLFGCSGGEEPVVSDAARPVKTLVVEAPDVGGVRNFPGRVDALQKAELAFRVPGTIKDLNVKEGDLVKEGEVLVTLDPTDFEIALKDAQASFDQAESDYERAKELVKDGFISRSDFDAKEAAWKNARAALDRTQQDLAYTELKASFPGTISQRYVQRFEEVQAKQPVLAMHDNSTLEVKVNVPESIILRMKPTEEGRPQPGRVPVTAAFESRPGKAFDLTLREVSTRADAATQTFEVTFTMPAPDDFLVFPGMTATVTADLSKVAMVDDLYLLPAAAVTADTGLDPVVWVVDEESMTVRQAPVEVGRLAGSSIEVKGGLEPGNRVVVAGVGHLAEGMKVRLLPEREEAEPRPSEVPAEPAEASASESDS